MKIRESNLLMATIFLSVLTNICMADTTSNELDFRRFDGHYKIVESEGLDSRWNFKCPEPIAVQNENGGSHLEAMGRCSAYERIDTKTECAPDLYIKGEQFKVDRTWDDPYETNRIQNKIFFSNEPIAEIKSIWAPGIADENIERSTCKDHDAGFFECLFTKTVFDFKEWKSVSKLNQVSFALNTNQAASDFKSIEKNGEILTLKLHSTSGGTDGTGRPAKDHEKKFKCVYKLESE